MNICLHFIDIMTSLDNMVTSNPAFINMIIIILGILYISIHYRLQTKFAKVMFSQVLVCPRGGGVFVQGGLCPGGCLYRGSLVSFQGVSVQGNVFVQGCLCPGGVSVQRGVCLGGFCPGEVSVQGCLCPGGLCPEGSLSRGVSVQGGFSVRETPYNKGWVVCILLECNVLNAFKEKIITFHDLHKLDLLAINLKRFSCEYFMMK